MIITNIELYDQQNHILKKIKYKLFARRITIAPTKHQKLLRIYYRKEEKKEFQRII